MNNLTETIMKKKDGDYRKVILPAKHEDTKAQIIALEKQALARWNNGDPDGFLNLSSDDVVYIDPAFKQIKTWYSIIARNARYRLSMVRILNL